jgi:hypothetical protein
MARGFSETSGSENAISETFDKSELDKVDSFDASLHELSNDSELPNEAVDRLESVETTETVERKDGSVSEVKYQDGDKVSETRTHTDGTVREIDYQPEVGQKSEVITKPDGSRTETVHWGNGEVTSETFAPDGHKTKTFENIDGKKSDTRFDENGVVSKKVETVDGQRTETRFDKNGEPYVTVKDGRTQLIPNNRYELRDGSIYKTDGLGRITSAEKATIGVKSEEGRMTINDKVEGTRSTDDRGHLIADRFGGVNRPENLVPQDSNLNRGEMKALENKAAEAVADGSEVDWKVEPQYEGDAMRPSSFRVTITIDGQEEEHLLDNEPSSETAA